MLAEDREIVARVGEAIAQIRNGRMVILVDDEDRENEGDLVIAAELVTPETINFMATHGRGLICLAMTAERCDHLNLTPMVSDNRSGFGTAFTVSIEAATGVTTGISAADRAHTIRTAVAKDARAADLARPGHVFPLRARPGGVLVRTGQTEGSVDLARLAGMEPAGVICEIMNADGTMARRPELEKFAGEHDLLIVSVADLIRYRLLNERLVTRGESVEIQVSDIGKFTAVTYTTRIDDLEHLALVKGKPAEDEPVLGRVHQESVLGDVFRVSGADSRWKLEYALRQIEAAGRGVVVYLQKPAPRLADELARIAGKQRPKAAVDRGAIGLPPDLREFGIGAQILLDQGVRQLKIITASRQRIKGVEGYGIEVVDQIVIPPRPAGGTPTDNSPRTPGEGSLS